MERPGEKLKRLRERLKLTYRDVEKASQEIASRRGNDEFAIALSRLADIENKQTVPTIFRIYTLSVIYRVDYQEVLRWYGVPVEMAGSDALRVGIRQTHPIQFTGADSPEPDSNEPSFRDGSFDPKRTVFLNHVLGRWGKQGFAFLNSSDLRQHRYGFIGLEDWSMHPILRPGALVLIDPSRRKIAIAGWVSEVDRPIYFVEHRDGYRCGWCSLSGGRLIIEAHPSSQVPPSVLDPGLTDILGQVTGVAMLLDVRKRRHARGGATPAASPDL